MSDEISFNTDYQDWATFISNKIKLAQTQTTLKINAELLTLYWEIGSSIIEKQNQNDWGSKIIDLLATDLANNFPENKGFSVRNLKYMRAFAAAYPQFPIAQVALAQPENQFVQVPLAQITWYHHISLLTKVKDSLERAFYITETAKNEWSRDVMLLQIQSNLYARSGKALNNFEQTLPEYISKLNFYISAIDDKLKTPTDEPTIGLLLCASKSNVKVEYAMRGLDKPLGVATYQLEQLVKENINKINSESTNDQFN